jgi:hypothetical protein
MGGLAPVRRANSWLLCYAIHNSYRQIRALVKYEVHISPRRLSLSLVPAAVGGMSVVEYFCLQLQVTYGRQRLVLSPTPKPSNLSLATALKSLVFPIPWEIRFLGPNHDLLIGSEDSLVIK